tara:strand:+ start:92 stop:559 length:468 start_codon:yes stop_codon:yes gene_type:complete
MTSPFPFVAGAILDAADLNAIGESETWTPSFSFGVTIGNGTVAGTYQQVNDFVIAQARFTLGSTSTVGTFVRADLPIAASDAFEVAAGTTGYVQDTSAGTYWAVHGRTYSSAATYLYGERRDASTEGIYYNSALSPITYAAGDLVQWQSVYRVGA